MKRKINRFAKQLDNIFGIKIFTLITISTSALLYVYSFVFSMNCEALYNIPAKYFSYTIFDIVPYGILIFLTTVALLYNHFFYKNNQQGQNLVDKTFYLQGTIIPGLVFFIIEFTIFYLLFIKNHYLIIYVNPLLLTIIVIILMIINIFSFIPVSHQNINKTLKSIIIATSVIIKVLVILGLFFTILNATPIKKSYETTSINNENYVILSEYESNYLVVKYEFTKENSIFYTSEYQLVDKEGLTIKQIPFKNIEYK